ncbi:erythromycin esterase family protein [Peptostreptococcus faecalis]|uniref:erythromycin esterase family protein n=1 Tax=Peptostreptococcus faecalis TaxID=2045015 RepID=UPI000C79B3E9|nr:erythromycin esterase family protein [Peptostreptococcus faecalis]
MNKKSIFSIIAISILSVNLLSGCGNSNPTLTSSDLSKVQTNISSLSVPNNIKIVGLGEAGHGVNEYHEMKVEVFKSLVKNNGCRSFVIEGDFGSALKVDKYIHGGNGSSKEIVKEIGFKIYKTDQLANLIDWMRTYNKTAPEGKDLHFYGIDIQGFDSNKEYLFSVLDKSNLELSKKYKSIFSNITDDNKYNISKEELNKSKENALKLLDEMDSLKSDIVKASNKNSFDFARECVNTIYQCSKVLSGNDADYNALRDKYMSEKAIWLLNKNNDNLIFINGHNGHIGKSPVAGYTTLGELLSKKLGNNYFAIGTDSKDTKFNSQDENGNFSVMEVENSNDLNSSLDKIKNNFYYVDFSKVENNKNWNKVLSEKQKITTLNVGISSWQKYIKFFYTTEIIPKNTFDSMIVFKEVNPTKFVK